jgi:protein SCO1
MERKAMNRMRCQLLIPPIILSIAIGLGCNRAKSPEQSAKRYALKGKVVSIDKNAGTVNINNEPIPGFMDSMVMSYTIKPASMLSQLQPGDSITADVVVAEGNYWLESVKVVGHSAAPGGKLPVSLHTPSLHTPSPGDDVPDFKLVNQSGKNISLHQYRGQTLLLTMIYTRCPFPDFCPRVSHEFAEIDRQLRADPGRFGKTHLLSISFDPAYDTPRVLREYGFSCVGSKDRAIFAHWEFAAVPKPELPQFADYFSLTYIEEGGLITHSLSTAVISADGKIFKWYHGADWSAADLLQDVAAAKRLA